MSETVSSDSEDLTPRWYGGVICFAVIVDFLYFTYCVCCFLTVLGDTSHFSPAPTEANPNATKHFLIVGKHTLVDGGEHVDWLISIGILATQAALLFYGICHIISCDSIEWSWSKRKARTKSWLNVHFIFLLLEIYTCMFYQFRFYLPRYILKYTLVIHGLTFASIFCVRWWPVSTSTNNLPV